jgi:hypothetical protein
MNFPIYTILISTLAGASPMADIQSDRALALEISETADGIIAVALKANSAVAQDVSYELQTSGSSSTTHKGSTRLTANQPATLSVIRFSASREWCVALRVNEQSGASYTIEKGGSCG